MASHRVKSQPRTRRGTRWEEAPTHAYTRLPLSASSAAICVPDCAVPITSAAPSPSCAGFRYCDECSFVTVSGKRSAHAGSRGAWKPPMAQTTERARTQRPALVRATHVSRQPRVTAVTCSLKRTLRPLCS